VDDGAGVAWVGQVVAEAGEELAESQDVGVDVEADLGRAGSCRGVLRQLITLCPPHGVDVQAEVVGDLLKGRSAVELTRDGFGGDAADRGQPETHQRIDPDWRDRSSWGRQLAGSSPDQSTRS
jgi:hypothetical protein